MILIFSVFLYQTGDSFLNLLIFIRKFILLSVFDLTHRLYIVFTILFLAWCTASIAQERVTVAGRVQGDSIYVEDIHILNLSSRVGTISNSYGEFQIPVRANDTLLFSGLQFNSLGIVVGKGVIETRRMDVVLISKIEELDEIELKGHDLDGFFYVDSKRLNDSLPLMSDEAVDFSNQGYDDPTSGNYIVPPANILGLLSKIGTKQRKENQKEQNYQTALKEAPDKIREELGDEFFTKYIGISVTQIRQFIVFCQFKNVLDLYVEGRVMEVIDLMLKEKEAYRKKYKLDD